MQTKIKKIKLKNLASEVKKIKASIKASKIIYLIDENVVSYFSQTTHLENLIIVHGGEKAKNFQSFEKVCEEVLSKIIDRSTHLIVIGGGAVIDLGGFVAASLLRGLDWSVVPTTLLSMVDTCLGGKVAINTSFGKNLVGAFHHPKYVFLDDSFLLTLPQKELDSGKGEILKYGMLSESISDLILKKASIDEIIIECLNYKKSIVKKDQHEKNIRKYLNFGHTYGHALELKFQIPHGIAIIYGMILIIKKFGNVLVFEHFKKLSKNLGLEIYLNQTLSDLSVTADLKIYDKKNKGNNEIDLVVMTVPFNPQILRVKLDQLK